MKLDSIQIKNVRGLSDKTIKLDMIPNKPSVLVAPNGTGKTSLALAFNRLNRNGVKLEKGEYYQDVEINKPEIIIVSDGVVYNATDDQNNISSKFAVQVINSRNKPQTIRKSFGGNVVTTTQMSVSKIVLDKVPSNTQFTYDFKVENHLDGFQRGVITKIDYLLDDESFMLNLDTDDINRKDELQTVNNFLNSIRSYVGQGSRDHILEMIKDNDIRALSRIPSIIRLVEKLRIMPINVGKHEARLFLDAIQLVFTYNKEKEVFKNKIKRYQYLKLKNRFDLLFASLKGTWKNISPKEVGNELIVEIENTEQISNGERDIIVFLTMLEKAKLNLNKDNNILIIDEIFDYLDDANYISAQYYITKYIEEIKEDNRKIREHNDSLPEGEDPLPEKTLFPIILTHLDPVTFKQFGYRDLKVYYFDDYSEAHVHENLKSLIHLRDTLEKEDKRNHTDNDVISKYLLHFHHAPVDLSATLIDPKYTPWRNPPAFKTYCEQESNKYIINTTPFDPFAVCIWLRECIEKYVYNRLPEDKKADFYAKDQHGTKNKLHYAKECGVDFPETFCLLGLIYNDPLHLGSNGETRSDIALAAKMRNKTIMTMIKSVMECV